MNKFLRLLPPRCPALPAVPRPRDANSILSGKTRNDRQFADRRHQISASPKPANVIIQPPSGMLPFESDGREVSSPDAAELHRRHDQLRFKRRRRHLIAMASSNRGVTTASL
jgi:hypothetical protein